MKFGIRKIELKKTSKINILIFSVLFVFISSSYILISSLNNTLKINTNKLNDLLVVMKKKEKELIADIENKKTITLVVNATIVTLNFKEFKLIKEVKEEFHLESEKILSKFWFLKEAKPFLATVKELKTFSQDLYLVNDGDITKKGEYLGVGGLVATLSNYRDYNMDDILINPFYNLKVSF